MRNIRIGLLGAAWLVLAQPATFAQDEPAAEAEAEAAETVDDEADADAADVVNEVLETDDDSYRDIDDEDFRPSEEIPADQSIAFPTDI